MRGVLCAKLAGAVDAKRLATADFGPGPTTPAPSEFVRLRVEANDSDLTAGR